MVQRFDTKKEEWRSDGLGKTQQAVRTTSCLGHLRPLSLFSSISIYQFERPGQSQSKACKKCLESQSKSRLLPVHSLLFHLHSYNPIRTLTHTYPLSFSLSHRTEGLECIWLLLHGPRWMNVASRNAYVKEQPEIVSHYSLSSIRPTMLYTTTRQSRVGAESQELEENTSTGGRMPTPFFRLPVDENYP